VEGLVALVRWICETCTQGVVHTQWLDLASVGFLVNYDRGIDVGAILLPVSDVFVNFLIENLT
jgi:hypothetical protein